MAGFYSAAVNRASPGTLNSHDTRKGVKMKVWIEMDLMGNVIRMDIE
jgi:hypothetical protein